MEPLTRLCSSGRRSPYTIRFNRVSSCRDFAVKFFADRGISLLGSFLVPLFPRVTECLISCKYRLRLMLSCLQDPEPRQRSLNVPRSPHRCSEIPACMSAATD
jgi:hypothetical protein